ncbi:MAG TPA: ribbon-helix-helix domain-containing protein [Candidatus Sericytochromatia bacterium]|jgi:Lon protease-like protein
MNPKRNRKSLDDALAQQFIYGEKPQEMPQEPVPKQTAPKQTPSEPPLENLSEASSESYVASTRETLSNESLLIDKLKTSPKEATIRFTVDLPQSTHRKLSLLAAMTGKTKAEIVRVLLNEALEEAGF